LLFFKKKKSKWSICGNIDVHIIDTQALDLLFFFYYFTAQH